MSFATVRTEIKTLLESVAGIGKVHDFRRHTRFWDDFFQRHVADGQVNNWEITRRSFTQDVFAVQNAAGNEPFFHDQHEILITGYMSLNDANETEKTFQTLVDNIIAKIRVNNQLNSTTILPRQLQVPIIEHRTFGGVLVHFAEMTFEAIERVGG